MALRTFLGAVIFCQLLVAMKGPRFASRPPELGDNLAPCVVLVDAEGTIVAMRLVEGVGIAEMLPNTENGSQLHVLMTVLGLSF